MPNEKMFDIGARIKLEKDTEFRNAVTGINKSLKSLKSELRLVEAQYDGNANSMEALQKKNEVLSRILEEHKNKVAATGNALKNAKDQYGKIGAELTKTLELFDKENGRLEETRKIYGESSEEVKKQEETLRNLELQINKGNKEYEKAGNAIKDWETKLNYANAEAIRAEGALGRNAAYMKEASESADGCAKSIDKFGKANKSAGNEIEEDLSTGYALYEDVYSKVTNTCHTDE